MWAPVRASLCLCICVSVGVCVVYVCVCAMALPYEYSLSRPLNESLYWCVCVCVVCVCVCRVCVCVVCVCVCMCVCVWVTCVCVWVVCVCVRKDYVLIFKKKTNYSIYKTISKTYDLRLNTPIKLWNTRWSCKAIVLHFKVIKLCDKRTAPGCRRYPYLSYRNLWTVKWREDVEFG